MVNSAKMGREDTVGFMRLPTSALWRERIQQFDGNATLIVEQAQKAGVAVVAVVPPVSTNAAMISRGSWSAEFDPYWLGNQPGSRCCGEPRRKIPGHPASISHDSGTGSELLPCGWPSRCRRSRYYCENMLARELTNGAVPALRAVSQQPVV